MARRLFFEHISRLYETALNVIRQKNQDYGGHETSDDPFKNFRMSEWLSVPVPLGILVRIADKLARLSNLLQEGVDPAVKDESVEDTILDAINYLAILHAYLASEREQKSEDT